MAEGGNGTLTAVDDVPVAIEHRLRARIVGSGAHGSLSGNLATLLMPCVTLGRLLKLHQYPVWVVHEKCPHIALFITEIFELTGDPDAFGH